MRTCAVRPVAISVLLAVSVACGEAADRESTFPGVGNLYRGRVSAQMLEPGRPTGEKDTGTGSAEFIEIGDGRSRLMVKGSIRKSGDAGFSLEGSGNASGWRGGNNDLRLTIDKNGNISGGGVADQLRIVFGGRATAQKIDLRVETEMLEQSELGVFPIETKTVFDYALERDRTKLGAGTSANNTSGQKDTKCKRIVWRTRNVTTPGGGMNMIQVPHCVD